MKNYFLYKLKKIKFSCTEDNIHVLRVLNITLSFSSFSLEIINKKNCARVRMLRSCV